VIETSCYRIASRFSGTKELPGHLSNPQILAMLRLDASWPQEDEVPWCSALVNYVAWLLELPRSRDLRARSWLTVGTPVDPKDATAENDVVVVSRGTDPLQGHVGFYAGHSWTGVLILGGNQGNAVSIAEFPLTSVLGVRRLG
jgi:uncharacterized protein (TIGR02594 family)